MLSVQKTTNLSGKSFIDDQAAATFSAQIDENNVASMQVNILNTDLFKANKDTVRKDQADFEKQVNDLEDGTATTD